MGTAVSHTDTSWLRSVSAEDTCVHSVCFGEGGVEVCPSRGVKHSQVLWEHKPLGPVLFAGPSLQNSGPGHCCPGWREEGTTMVLLRCLLPPRRISVLGALFKLSQLGFPWGKVASTGKLSCPSSAAALGGLLGAVPHPRHPVSHPRVLQSLGSFSAHAPLAPLVQNGGPMGAKGP